MRRYLVLLLVTLAAGAVLAAFHGRTGGAAPGIATSAGRMETALAITVSDSGVSPPTGAVPMGSRVRLEVAVRTRAAVRLSLAGYEDRVSLEVAPGGSTRACFTADRPGEDFAWLVNGKPVGRLAVTGSHLVEGHR